MERMPTFNQTPYVKKLRAQRDRILQKVSVRAGDDAKLEMWEKMTEHALALQEKYGVEEVRRYGAFHMLAGSTMYGSVHPEKEDFDGEDAIARYLESLEKEV